MCAWAWWLTGLPGRQSRLLPWPRLKRPSIRECLASDAFLKSRWPASVSLRCCLNLLEEHQNADGGGIQKVDFLASHPAGFAYPCKQFQWYFRLKRQACACRNRHGVRSRALWQAVHALGLAGVDRLGCRGGNFPLLPMIQMNRDVQIALPVDGNMPFNCSLAGLFQPVSYLNAQRLAFVVWRERFIPAC